MSKDKHQSQAPKDQPVDLPQEVVAGIQQLQQQAADLTEALQRERADSVNIRRRHDEQIASLKTTIKAQVIRELLPVIDNFERALKHLPTQDAEDKQVADWIAGIKKILHQFESTLTTLGVVRIATVDQPFDPRFHEAVSMSDEGGSQEIVAEELQSGYALGDEVIRHAMVRVHLI